MTKKFQAMGSMAAVSVIEEALRAALLKSLPWVGLELLDGGFGGQLLYLTPLSSLIVMMTDPGKSESIIVREMGGYEGAVDILAMKSSQYL